MKIKQTEGGAGEQKHVSNIFTASHASVPTYSQNTVRPMTRSRCPSDRPIRAQSQLIRQSEFQRSPGWAMGGAGGGVCVNTSAQCRTYR